LWDRAESNLRAPLQEQARVGARDPGDGEAGTRALIRDFGQGCDVKLVGSARLAGIAEAALRGEPVDESAISAEIAPALSTRPAVAPT
jgi:hypothetical protein